MPATDPSWRPGRRAPVGVVSIVVLTVLAAGCGSSGHGTTTATRPHIKSLHDLRVTRQQVDAVGKGSPSAALLSWWRALQLNDVPAAEAAYARSVNLRRSDRRRLSLRGELAALSFYLRRSRPEIVDVKETDGTARVSTVIDAARFKTPTAVKLVRQTPTSFELRREAGRWKLANDDYLKQNVQIHMPKFG
jgi:hypothetical protein